MQTSEEIEQDETAQHLSEVEALAPLFMSIMCQLFAQGANSGVTGVAALVAGAKVLRLKFGPDEAATMVRVVADEVEADRERLDA
jgi:hypothetical protein